MAIRVRNRNLSTQSGKLFYGSSLASTSSYTSTENSTDVIGNYGFDHDFEVVTRKFDGGQINGTSFYRYENFHSVISGVLDQPAKLTSQQAFDFRNRLFANTGPLTPKVHLPVFIFELREIPLLLKHYGDIMHKLVRNPLNGAKPYEIGAATLAYKFGWQPLMQDMSNITLFMELVKERQDQIKRANSSRGLTKRITLGQDAGSRVFINKPFNTFINGDIYGDYITSYKTETWGTCRWKVRDNQLIGTVPDKLEAFKSAFALKQDYIHINVWKALPWSWLIDWFTDLSQGLQASYNMITYRPVMACIMQRSETRTSAGSLKSSNKALTMTPISNESVRKQRFAIPVDSVLWPTMRVPFLDTFKLSILGSLHATRYKGGR